MLLQALLNQISARFADAGIESHQADAELIVGHALALTRGEVLASAIARRELTASEIETIEALIARREAREPLQHITGVAHFRNLELVVGPGVFIPRPETEFVAQLAIDAARASVSDTSPNPLAVDLGTGSGAIALSIATEVPDSRVFAIEKSEDAFPYTQRNFAALAPTATLVKGDLANAFEDLNGTVSVVVSNPPYIPTDAIPRDLEVRLHDPELALYGGLDGMSVIRFVSSTARKLLSEGGMLIIEHADSQAPQVSQLLLADGWLEIKSHQDLTGRDRAVTAIR